MNNCGLPNKGSALAGIAFQTLPDEVFSLGRAQSFTLNPFHPLRAISDKPKRGWGVDLTNAITFALNFRFVIPVKRAILAVDVSGGSWVEGEYARLEDEEPPTQ
jgi:hypothetical protein